MKQTGHVTEALGAHVLDSLEPDERRSVEAHLAVCATCRAEYQRLATLPAMLDLLQAGRGAVTAMPPAHLEDAVVALFVNQQRRASRRGRRPLRGRWRIGVATMGGALAGVAATLAVTGPVEPDLGPEQIRLAATDGSGASGQATLVPSGPNTRITLKDMDLAPTLGGEVYEVWLVNRGGRVSAGTFTVSTRDGFDFELNAAGSPKDYDRIGITLEPDARDPAKNGPSVLAAPIETV